MITSMAFALALLLPMQAHGLALDVTDILEVTDLPCKPEQHLSGKVKAGIDKEFRRELALEANASDIYREELVEVLEMQLPDPEPVPYVPEPAPQSDDVSYSAEDLRYDGRISDGDYTYTWYSEQVLPGGGLDIPGRHLNEYGFVVDGEGRIAVASTDHERGTELETAFGTAVVYDTGYLAPGQLDVYVGW